MLQTTGNIRALVVVVDFTDVKYNADKRLSDEALSTYLFGTDNTSFYPCESLTNYFSRASYGALHMTGNVFHYTAKGTIASYETTDDGYETMNSPTLIPWIIILEHSPTNTDTAWDSRIIINMD